MASGVRVAWFGEELRAPVRSGRLKASGYVATAGRTTYARRPRDRRRLPRPRAGEVVVAFAAHYARYVEAGARAHVIEPVARRAVVVGEAGPRRRAAHPGIGRRPFMGPALAGLRERGGQALVEAMRRVIEARMPGGSA
jgi:hypothetical protein